MKAAFADGGALQLILLKFTQTLTTQSRWGFERHTNAFASRIEVPLQAWRVAGIEPVLRTLLGAPYLRREFSDREKNQRSVYSGKP